MAPSGFPANFAGIYTQPCLRWSKPPILDSICIQWDGKDDLTVSCFIGGEAFKTTFKAGDFTWTGDVTDSVPFDSSTPEDGGIKLEVSDTGVPYLHVVTQRTTGLKNTDPVTIGPLVVLFKQTLRTTTTEACLDPDETGVFVHVDNSQFVVLCNGFIVSNGTIDHKVVDTANRRVSFDVGSDEWQLQLGTDTYLWEGSKTSTMKPHDHYKLIRSFVGMGNPLDTHELPAKYIGEWSATTLTKNKPKFTVELGKDLFRVFSEDDGDVWHSHTPEYMDYDFLLNFDDKLVIGRGQYGVSFILGLGGWNCISLFDERGEHTSEVVLKGYIPTPDPTPTSDGSKDGSPIILMVLALAAVWAMK